MDFISFLIFFGICVGVFLGFFLISVSRGNKRANRLFGLLLLLYAFSISGFLVDRLNAGLMYPWLLGAPQIVLFLFGPLFIFYVKVITRRKFVFREEHIVHFLPFVFITIYRIPLFIKSPAEKLEILQSHPYRLESIAILLIQIVHLFLYIYFTDRQIAQHQAKIKTTMSSIDKINLRWLKMSTYFFVAVFAMMLVFTILFISGIDLFFLFNLIIPLSVSAIISFMGYYALKQPIIFPDEPEKVSAKKYGKSNLSEELEEEYLRKLHDYMQNEKPYLQSNLTLQKLASALGMSPHHLSQVINEKLNQNFFDFINQYRVKEAQRMLVDPRGQLLTILAVSEEVGFNSKTAFNTAFKKITNMTPSEFRKNHV